MLQRDRSRPFHDRPQLPRCRVRPRAEAPRRYLRRGRGVLRAELDSDNIVVDIGLATTVLHQILGDLNFRNLDDETAFRGQNTTTEFLARVVFNHLAAAIARGDLGANASGIDTLRVTLKESHVASASSCRTAPRRVTSRALRRPDRAGLPADAHGRLRLRPAHRGGPARAWLVRGGARTRRELPLPHAASEGRRGRGTGGAAGLGQSSSQTAWRTARCQTRRVPTPGRLRIVALVHHPLAEESGLDAATALTLAASEHDALRSARHVVVTSRQTAALLPAYGVTPDRITVVEPGTDPAPPRAWVPVRRHAPAVRGHADTAQEATPCCCALSQVAHLPRHLTCVGGAIDAETARHLEAQIASLGFGDRVTLAGEGDDEALADALRPRGRVRAAHAVRGLRHGGGRRRWRAGCRVIGTSTGAIADLVGHDAGIVALPSNDRALAGALELVLQDAPVRARLSAGAQRARLTLATWADRRGAHGGGSREGGGRWRSPLTGSTLREPADHAARSRGLTRRVVERLTTGAPGRDTATDVAALSVLDLGSGTGSNLRVPRAAPARHAALDVDGPRRRPAAGRGGTHRRTREPAWAHVQRGRRRRRAPSRRRPRV